LDKNSFRQNGAWCSELAVEPDSIKTNAAIHNTCNPNRSLTRLIGKLYNRVCFRRASYQSRLTGNSEQITEFFFEASLRRVSVRGQINIHENCDLADDRSRFRASVNSRRLPRWRLALAAMKSFPFDSRNRNICSRRERRQSAIYKYRVNIATQHGDPLAARSDRIRANGARCYRGGRAHEIERLFGASRIPTTRKTSQPAALQERIPLSPPFIAARFLIFQPVF